MVATPLRLAFALALYIIGTLMRVPRPRKS